MNFSQKHGNKRDEILLLRKEKIYTYFLLKEAKQELHASYKVSRPINL